jgi:hypothetical protein
MAEHKSVGRAIAEGGGRFVVHIAAVVVGLILMVIGLAMGVSVVLLPVSIPVGLVGLLALLWGLFGFSPEQPANIGPPDGK